MTVPDFLRARRSVRAFTPDPIDRSRLDVLVSAALLAPAPHHSQPWRWAVCDSSTAKRALAEAMGARWSRDLQADKIAFDRINKLVEDSIIRISTAPAALLGCLTHSGLDQYPDEARQRAEWGMASLSLGAAVENLMLCATDMGLASCWVAAPIFCAEEARRSINLPDDWLPQALILVGNPDPNYIPRTRPPVALDEFRTFH